MWWQMRALEDWNILPWLSIDAQYMQDSLIFVKLGRDVLSLLSTCGGASDLETSCGMSNSCFTQCLLLRPKTALCVTLNQSG